jgi:hypothetical protein
MLSSGRFISALSLNILKYKYITEIVPHWENSVTLTRIRTSRKSFPLLWLGPLREPNTQLFLHSCVCIRCRRKVFTELFPSTNRRILVETHRLREGIYGVRRWDWLGYHDIHTKFHEDWVWHSEIGSEGDSKTKSMVISQAHFYLYIYFFQNKESKPKNIRWKQQKLWEDLVN